MSHVRYTLEDGGLVIFEVDERAAGSAGPQPVSRLGDALERIEKSFDASLEAIRAFAAILVARLRSTAPDPPSEIEVTFGIKAVAEMQAFAIAKAATEANYTVRLKWIRPV